MGTSSENDENVVLIVFNGHLNHISSENQAKRSVNLVLNLVLNGKRPRKNDEQMGHFPTNHV